MGTHASKAVSHTHTGIHQHSDVTIRSLQDVRYIQFGGGGARGCAHIGVYTYVKDQHIQLDGAAGVSAGAIISLAIALNLTPDECAKSLSSAFSRSSASNLSTKPTCIPKTRTSCGYGRVSMDPLRVLLSEVMTHKHIQPDITFKELFHASNKFDLRIGVWNNITSQVHILSADTTPDACVLDSVLASSSVQHIFPPVDIQGTCFSDCAKHVPLLVDQWDPAQTLHILLQSRLRKTAYSRTVVVNTSKWRAFPKNMTEIDINVLIDVGKAAINKRAIKAITATDTK